MRFSSAGSNGVRRGWLAAALAALGVPVAPQQVVPAQTALVNPSAIAVNPATHRMYAVDQSSHRVIMLDAVSGQSTNIPVGKSPDALAVDPDLNRIFVVNSGSDTVSVIDGASETVLASVPTGRMPYAIGIDPAMHRVLVMNTYSNFATQIDETTNHAAALPVGAKDAVVIDTRLHQAWLLGYEDPSLTVIDKSGAAHRSRAAMHLWGLVVDDTRGIVYATESQSRAILAVHEASGAQVTIPSGAMPCAAAVDPQTGMVYVVNYADNSVTVVDGRAGQPVATIPVGNHPQAIAVDAPRGLVYVANTHSDSVSVIDARINRVIATLPAGRNPYALAVDSKRGDLYAANFGSPAYTRIDTTTVHH